jgi:cytolysin (calcineurin-like family phosphatase)
VYGKDAPWNDPQHALSFLQQDLKEQVGDSGRPVIVMWHYGLRGWGLEMWWLPEDLENLKNTLKPYNVVLILHGHEHRYERYQWERFDVIMAPSPQYDRDPKDPASVSRPKGFVVVRVAGDQLQTALYTAKGWSEQWNKTMKLGRPAAVVKGR